MSRICLPLPGPDWEENRRIAQDYLEFYQALEFRLDLCPGGAESAVKGIEAILEIPGLLLQLEPEVEGDFSLILTLRKTEDGGRFDGSTDSGEGFLRSVLEGLAGSPFWHSIRRMLAVDLEKTGVQARLQSRVSDLGLTVIRSVHDFSGCPDDIDGLLEDCAAGGAVPKLALTPRGLADLIRLAEASTRFALSHPGRPCILLGMGEYGSISRIIPEKFNSCISFAAAGKALAPGQIDAEILHREYRNTAGMPPHSATPLFVILGNPVGHSRSPSFHNSGFRRDGIHALYLPLLCDDAELFPAIAESLGILGASVTIPHKEAVRKFLSREDGRVRGTRSCNTLLRLDGGGWEGTNSDVPGFLAPVLDEIRHFPRKKALIIGAGGAGRSIAWALLSEGWSLCITNRRGERARELASFLEAQRVQESQEIEWVPLDELGTLADLEGWTTLIVQTGSAGMQGELESIDPLAAYEFRGHEMVYDIIYTPEKTRLLARAEKAGCRVINGKPMFLAQAELQYRQFLSLLEARRLH